MSNRILLLLLAVMLSVQFSSAQIHVLNPLQKQHIEVSMRMVGHQLLLHLGDSSSRVLPIETEGNKYRINFESEFAFNPDDISGIVDSVMAETNIASEYVVEVLSCESDIVEHSYKIGTEAEENIRACRGRDYPKGCYSLSITVLNYTLPNELSDVENAGLAGESPEIGNSKFYRLLIGLFLLVLVLIGAIVYRNRQQSDSVDNPNVIQIGKYRFNKRNMELWFEEEKIELTSKECDLLQLLCDSTNDTVERETILKMVWGDDGDYVGRTLDVFISKLRKKLEADDSVRIVNIRGIGYKLVLNN